MVAPSASSSSSATTSRAPQKAQPLSSRPTSTLLSVGSNNNESHQSSTSQLSYVPYITQDLQSQKILKLVDFSATVLKLNLMEEVEKIKPNHSLELRRKAYCQSRGGETARYQPFVEYVNDIIQRENPNASIKLCRNDPALWWGINSDRKPDVNTVTEASITEDGRDSVDNLAEKGPFDKPFHPTEVLSFWEFKRIIKDLMSLFRQVKAEEDKSKIYGIYDFEEPKRELEASTSSGSKKRTAPDAHDPPLKKSQRIVSTPAYVPGITPAPAGASLKELKETPETQCASYALEMMSHGLRQHVISFFIVDSTIEFLYYDRSILLRSQPLDFIRGWHVFECIIKHISTFSLQDWGIRNDVMPGLEPAKLLKKGLVKPLDSPRGIVHNLFEGIKVSLPDYGVLELDQIIHQTHGLRGRGTLVLTAKAPKPDQKEVVLKISWPARTRKSEAKILQHINDKIGDASEHQWVKKHIPKLLHAHDFATNIGIQGRIFKHFQTVKEQNGDLEDNPYEERILRVHVFERLYHITDFIEKPATFIGRRYFELVKALVWVHDFADVLHCDVSLRNFMIRKEGSELYGVLNDFDLAIMRADAHKGPHSKQRTGTRPYIAIDLLDSTPPPPHILRHDLESSFYLFVDLAHFASDRFDMASWSGLNARDLVNAKRTFLAGMRAHELLSPKFAEMADYLLHVFIFFQPYTQSLNILTSVPAFKDADTCDGQITGDKFVTVADTYLPREPNAPNYP